MHCCLLKVFIHVLAYSMGAANNVFKTFCSFKLTRAQASVIHNYARLTFKDC
jgi:hypothetical protein